jgi:hypothetical protein
MVNPPLYPNPDDDTSVGSEHRSGGSTPRWVKLFGLIVLALALLFIGLRLFGGDNHGPGQHTSFSGSDGSTPSSDMTASSVDGGRLPVGGVLVAQDGYKLELLSSNDAAAGEPLELTFRIMGPDGTAVTSFTPIHDQEMHLIVVRWDLTNFQHGHPTMEPDGTWRLPITFEEAGDYRAYADFAPEGRSEAMTLATNIPVSGSYNPVPLPGFSAQAPVDDYTVELEGELVGGETSELTFTVTKNGEPVTDLQPYLAAYGHLVVLRDGDLAYLHVHPEGEHDDGTEAGPDITFQVETPTAGNYRLFLDFKHDGTVRTVDFTIRARPSITEIDNGVTPHAGGH